MSAAAPVPASVLPGYVPARDARIDAAKALAIVLVVLGHAKGIPHAFTILVYSFHVPLFFLMSGWVGEAYGARARSGPLPWRKLVRTLLVPYLCFFLLGYAYWLLTRDIGGKALRWGDRPWWEPLRGLASGIGPDLYVQPALWFLPALFVTTLAFSALRRTLAPGWLALGCVPLALLWIGWFPRLGLRLPFGLDILPVSLAFFVLGAWLSRLPRLLPQGIAANVVTALVLALPWCVLAWRNDRVDVNMLVFGHSASAFLVAALLGSLMTLCAARLLQGAAWLQWIGRNTLLILCTHLLVFFVLSGVAALAGLFDGGRPGFGWAVFVSAFALAAAVPMRWMFMRWAPWMLGAQRGGRQRAATVTAPMESH